MPTIIDSLFIQLGFDVSKLPADQQKALAELKKFEQQTKQASGKAAQGVKSVGTAFKDLASNSAIGASGRRIDGVAEKLKNLGEAAQAAGGAGGPIGGVATGLASLLSPTSLGIAAVGLLGKELWDFNDIQTKVNATMARNVELSGMSADNYWAMGEAAKTVGGDPAAVQAGIDSLQTTLAGAAIGIGNAQAQMIGMARLAPYGAHFNAGGFGQGANEESLFKGIRNFKRQHGRAQALALWLASGFGSADQFDLAVSKDGWQEYKKAQDIAKKIKAPGGGGLKAIMAESVKGQVGIGEKDITAAAAAEQAYGVVQKPMESLVELARNSLIVLNAILRHIVEFVDYLTGGKAADAYDSAKDAVKTYANKVAPGVFAAQSPDAIRQKEMVALDILRKAGESPLNAEAMAGNFAQESQFDPFATSDNGAHIGIAQLDRTRQAAFAKWAGYKVGDSSVGKMKQLVDQVQFSAYELKTTHKKAQRAMDSQSSLFGKTLAFQNVDEMPGAGDMSFGRRFGFAREASNLMQMLNVATAPTSHTVNTRIRNDTYIGTIAVTTPSSNPQAHAAAVGSAITKHQLLSPIAQQQVMLSTGSMTQ